MSEKKAIVTLCIGEKYQSSFKKYFYEGWKQYANRHGIDIVVLTDPLDQSPRAKKRSPAWQKCLVHKSPEVTKYDRIAWIDCDIIIRPDSPNIFQVTHPEKIGAVDDFSTPTKEDHGQMLWNLYTQWEREGIFFYKNISPKEYYSNYGLDCNHDRVIQTGMMLFNPGIHGSVFESVYYKYEDGWGAEMNYEMRPLSYEILNNHDVEWLSPKFNMQWEYYKSIYYSFLKDREAFKLGPLGIFNGFKKMLSFCARSAYEHNYFLHFAGGSQDFRFIFPEQ